MNFYLTVSHSFLDSNNNERLKIFVLICRPSLHKWCYISLSFSAGNSQISQNNLLLTLHRLDWQNFCCLTYFSVNLEVRHLISRANYTNLTLM
ncbi:hypothetical protein C0J52_26686 [Blattella germanica]|nr:hypothetical protein C0J52_26686 [Blattella germanica]